MGEIIEPSAPKPVPVDNSRRNNMISGVAIVAVAAALMGFGIWKYLQPDVGELTAKVKSSMQSQLSSDANFVSYHLRVKDVNVIHSSGNEYKGIATVSAGNGPNHDVAVQVTFDGEQMMWQTQPGAFMWAVQERMASTSP